MGRLRSAPAALPEAGELLPVVAIDPSGVAITKEGAFVRVLQVTPKNPYVMSGPERANLALSFAALVGHLRAGQSLQFYVQAVPVRLDALLDQGRRELAHLADRSHEDPLWSDRHASALARLAHAHEESILSQAYYQSAVELGVYVVVPFVPERGRGEVSTLRPMLPKRGPKLPSGPLRRPLQAHERAMRDSLVHADGIRSDLEALDLHARMLDGNEVASLLLSRFNPTSADRGEVTSVEVADWLSHAEDPAARATHLRETVAGSAIDFASQRYVRVDRDLEQVIYLAGTADATYFGWLAGALAVDRPFTLSVYVHALDRLRERQRIRHHHRRLFGVNRGAAFSDRPADYEMLEQEGEMGELLRELSSGERASLYELSIYQSLREPGPQPDPSRLADAVDVAVRELTIVSDARVSRGEFLQQDLWESTLPLGRDVARRTRKYVSRNVGDTLPLTGTSCGSPTGIPFALSVPGRTIERLNPWDPAHDNMTLLINGKSGSGKTLATNIILSRLLAYGVHAFVLDRAGHYAFLCELVPDARHLTIGAGEDDHAVNPWDTPDLARVPPEKVTFLVGLHAMLVGDRAGGVDSYG